MSRWTPVAFLGLALLGIRPICSQAADGNQSPPPLPSYRIETEGFSASESDIRAVLDSAARQLWPLFPDYRIEPFVVTRGHSGPITLFQRNDRGEIVVRLDTEKTSWSQYAYQFAHEFCHVLCGFKPGYEGNKWFEETVCETASLYAMRGMSRSWRTAPPFPNWRDYHDALGDYSDNIIRNRDKVYEVYSGGLSAFYRSHQAVLTKEPTSRELNGAMSLVLLHLFEERPERWEAVRWLNATPTRDGDTFKVYLQNWHDAAPARQQAFIKKVADLYGIAIRSRAPAEPKTASTAQSSPVDSEHSMTRFRVDPEGFNASEADIRAVLDSAGRQLWRYFPGHSVDRIVVVRSHNGPTVLYARNPQGEVVVKLDTEGALWCQYAYQFSYLFAEIVCGFDEKSVGNKWFEVSIGEAASLFALKQMALAWERDPPYPNWKEYHSALAQYVQGTIDRRQKLEPEGLKAFYQKHRQELARGTDMRPLCETISVALVKLFEEQPEHWEAIRWLNSRPSPQGESLEKYLQRWHDTVPEKHKAFVEIIADRFGVRLRKR